jgi:2-keto-3-deoxy-L-rhamnonate aldolase RhmA
LTDIQIKARSQSAKAVRTTLAGALDSPGVIHRASTAEQQEELRRRSTLSRLEGIAEGVWMMFSGPASLSAPRGRRKAIPLLEVADMIVKSSKTPISNGK